MADEADMLPHAREHDRVMVTGDVSDFGDLPAEAHAGVVLPYDDTMPACRVASGLIAVVDAYPDRDAFGGREELDAWV